MPRSAVGVGMLVGLLVGGATGAVAGTWLASARPGGESAPLLMGAFLAGVGLVFGAVVASVINLVNVLIGRRAVPLDGPEADYREPTDPPA
jgi:hypothetical protein